ncbi:uncharacterized protein NPIL_82401 [Nephila pilipes]|uniref:Gustatory receptor n=1 Tax=Nephila pilipes TaxID=299642 RepID=A0A8X6UT23_NEPPI|nr:uncharacterized protein NPIL_82401 [Nephila pilipes]
MNYQHDPTWCMGSGEKFKIFWKDQLLFRISDQNPSVPGIPNFLLKLLRCYGLIENSNKNCFYRTAGIVFRFIIISISLSVLLSACIQYNTRSLKMECGTIGSYILTLAVYFAMNRKKELLKTIINKLRRFPLRNRDLKLNLFTFTLCSMPAIYSVSIILTCNKRWTAKYHAYGYEVEQPIAQMLLIGIKTFLNALVYPTFTNLVALVFCALCQRCCLLIKSLTQDILRISPNAFGPSAQMEILRRQTKINNILESIQEIFSLPSFFIFATHFMSCANIIGWLLCFDLASYKPHMFTQSIFFGVNAFGCLVAILWIVGGLPVQMQKLKEAFYKKAHLRLLILGNLEEPQLKREFFDMPEFVFTGCEVISFRRRTILAFFGTLLTYTVLVINMKDHRP